MARTAIDRLIPTGPAPSLVKQNPEKPVERAVLAQAIVDLSDAAKKLDASGLNERAIVILLSESSGVTKTNVRFVLAHLKHLAKNYTK